MTRKKEYPQKRTQQRPQATPQPREKAEKKSKKLPAWFPYALGLALLWLFCSCIYGSVFTRAAQDSFVTFDGAQMKFLTDQSGGYLYWGARVLLLSFKSAWAGGLFLALLLSASAWLLDHALHMPRKFRGASFLLPLALLGYFVYRGLNIYHKTEPSIIFLYPVLLLAATALCAGITAILHRKGSTKKEAPTARLFSPGNIILLAASILLYAAALWFNQNDILTARMQNRAAEGNWEGIIDDALSARRPTRAVAAYYAIALVQTNQLLERVFDIPFDYPDPHLDKIEGNSEYAIFVPDANFYAGLVNAAYHSAMELTVMNGPRLHNLKRMAICAILNDEKPLAEKLLKVIGSVPFESGFVEKYRPMLYNRQLLAEDPELANVSALAPLENKFEQNYRTPAFLGYNLGLTSGSDPTLLTSIAACLYTKDLNNMLVRANILKSKSALPTCVQQAIIIASLKRPGILKEFPGISPYMSEEIRAFIMDAKPYIKDKEALRKELKEKWLGTYMYYYYCENNTNNQQKDASNSGAVN